VRAAFDAAEESCGDDPFVGEADVVGWFPADSAAASRSSVCENRDGLLRVDD